MCQYPCLTKVLITSWLKLIYSSLLKTVKGCPVKGLLSIYQSCSNWGAKITKYLNVTKWGKMISGQSHFKLIKRKSWLKTALDLGHISEKGNWALLWVRAEVPHCSADVFWLKYDCIICYWQVLCQYNRPFVLLPLVIPLTQKHRTLNKRRGNGIIQGKTDDEKWF